MAIVRENSAASGGSIPGTSGIINVSLGFLPTVGRKLLMGISHFSQATITWINHPGVVWTKVAEAVESATQGDGVKGELWHGDVVGSAPAAITLNISTDSFGDSLAAVVHEMSGMRDIWPFEAGAAQHFLSSNIMGVRDALNITDEAYQFAVACQAHGSDAIKADFPFNSFANVATAVGTGGAFLSRAHRCTSAEKFVSARTIAWVDWIIGGFDRYANAIGNWAADSGTPPPIELVQQVDEGTLDNALDLELPAAPTEGNTLLMAVVIRNGITVASVVQAGASWTRDAQITHSTSNLVLEIWRASNLPPTVSVDVAVNLTGASDVVASVQEYSGVLAVAPVDQSATAQGSNDPVLTGLMPATTEDNVLLFAAMGTNSVTSNYQECFGFKRAHLNSVGGISAATFIQNLTYQGVQYQASAKQLAATTWVGGIVAYKSAVETPAPGVALNVYGDEIGQSGVVTSVGSTQDILSIPASTFVDGHRHLVLVSVKHGTPGGRAQFELRVNGGAQTYDLGEYRTVPVGSESHSVNRVLTLNASDDLALRVYYFGVAISVYQASLVVIDLDSGNFFEGRDWWHDENTDVIAQMDSVFANNVGAKVRYQADGESSYLVIGHAKLTATSGTSQTAEMAMQLWDKDNAVELAKCGWQRLGTLDPNRKICMNVMAVLEQPPDGQHELEVRCVGGTVTPPDGWDHNNSSMTVIRLDHFFKSGYAQDLALNQSSPASKMPPEALANDAVVPQLGFIFRPDILGEMITALFVQADNSADDNDGIATTAEYPNIDSGDRSLWDTGDTTLGNIVQTTETLNGSSAGGSVVTRIPTWAVTRRTGVGLTPASVLMHNGGRPSNASVINRLVIACFGRHTVAAGVQPPPPDPIPPPQPVTKLTEKPDGTHEAEAFDNQLEQFKP